MLSEAEFYGGPVCLNPHVNSNSDGLGLLQKCFHRRSMALIYKDKIIFSENGSNRYVNTPDYINSAGLNSGSNITIDLEFVCRELNPIYKTPAFDVIPRCVPEKLRCQSVTKVKLDEKEEQPIMVSFTNRGIDKRDWVDISVVRVDEEREPSPPKKQCKSFLGAVFSENAARTSSFSSMECSYKESTLACKSFTHSHDIFTIKGCHLVQYISTSVIFNKDMVEDKVYLIYISSYENRTNLRKLCRYVPNIFLFNEKLSMMQQIPLPMHQIMQNKSKDANPYGIGGFIKHQDEIYFIAPEHFPCLGNIWAPIGDTNQNKTAIHNAYRLLDEFSQDLKKIFTNNQLQPPPQPSSPQPSSSSSSIHFKSMWIIHNSPKVIKKILSYPEPDSCCLFALVDDTNVRYFNEYQKLVHWINNKTNNKKTPISNMPALALPVGTCLDSPALLYVNVIDNPFNGWREALACITNMDEIKIFVDEKMATKDDLIKCGSYLISGQLILVRSSRKTPSLVSSSLLAPLSSIFVWNESDSKPTHYSGFKIIPTGNRLIPRTNIAMQELWIDESTSVTVSNFTTYLMNNSIANHGISQELSLVVYQIGVICTEGELRSVILRVKENIAALMIECTQNLAAKQITPLEYDDISKNLNSFLTTLATTDNGGVTSAEILVQRMNIASNVEEVKNRGFNPMDVEGSCLIFDISGENSVTNSDKIPLALDYKKTKLDTISCMTISTFSDHPNTFIHENFQPNMCRVFVYPMYDDAVNSINEIASQDWMGLASKQGGPSNLARIAMRNTIAKQIKEVASSGAVSKHLQQLIMSMVRVLNRHGDNSEFYTKVNKNLFIILTLSMMSCNRLSIPRIAYIFQPNARIGKMFFNKKINVDILKHLIHLLHVTDFEDKLTVLENLKNNVQSFIDIEFIKPLAESTLKRSTEDLKTVGMRLINGLETVLMTKALEVIDWDGKVTKKDVRRHDIVILGKPAANEQLVANEVDERMDVDDSLIQLAHWFLKLLTSDEYKMENLVLAESSGVEKLECIRTLTYLRGIAREYTSPKNEFGLGKKKYCSHVVGKIAFTLFYYLRRSNCCDHENFLYNLKKSVAKGALKNPHGELWEKVKVHCALIPGVKASIARLSTYDRAYTDILDSIFRNSYTVDKIAGTFHHECVKSWEKVLAKYTGDLPYPMNVYQSRAGECFSLHPPLASLLTCLSKAVDGYKKKSPQFDAFVRLINHALVRQFPDNAALKVAEEKYFYYYGEPSMKDFGSLSMEDFNRCSTWMTKGASPRSLFANNVHEFNLISEDIMISDNQDCIQTATVLRDRLGDNDNVKNLLEICDFICSFDKTAVMK